MQNNTFHVCILASHTRHVAYYWTQMSQLPNSNPEVHEYLADGGFSAQLSAKNKCGKVSLEYIVEKPNRAIQVKGGIVNFSRNVWAVERWI